MTIKYFDKVVKKEDEDKVVLIPFDERLPELEDKVKYHMSVTTDLPHNDIEFKRAKIPTFASAAEKAAYENEEMDRCEFGYKGMCGKMYFWWGSSNSCLSPEGRIKILLFRDGKKWKGRQ